MRVLQVNKYGTRTSGADNYFLDVGARLADAGHAVAYACMRPTAVPTEAPLFEVPDIEFHSTEGLRAKAAAAGRVLWSRAARAVLERALDEFRPDVVHLHNYAHQLSSSVVVAAKQAGVRTVATAHDYKLVCPAYTAMRDERPCFRCAPGNPAHCLGGRCLHGSVMWSAVGVAEAAFVRAGRSTRVPDAVFAPSQYMADRLQESWLSSTTLETHVVRNPIEGGPDKRQAPSAAGGGIYVGRLSGEKGLSVLVRSAARAGVGVTVVGDGPERADLEALAARLDAPVTFTGFLKGPDLEREWQRASFFVMTSTWPENAPLALLEALVRGLPAILSDVGGLPELPALYGGGRMVPPGDVSATAASLADFGSGRRPRSADVSRLKADLSWDTHLGSLLEHYGEDVARAH